MTRACCECVALRRHRWLCAGTVVQGRVRRRRRRAGCWGECGRWRRLLIHYHGRVRQLRESGGRELERQHCEHGCCAAHCRRVVHAGVGESPCCAQRLRCMGSAGTAGCCCCCCVAAASVCRCVGLGAVVAVFKQWSWWCWLSCATDSVWQRRWRRWSVGAWVFLWRRLQRQLQRDP
jgi:hypothetical protein